MSRVAVVTGLAIEAAIARHSGAPAAASGAIPAKAAALATEFVRQGARGLVSFGVAGGLSLDLCAGDVVLGASVSEGPERWPADAHWLAQAARALPDARCGTIAASNVIVGSIREKSVLAQTGALAVDMESGAVARVAAAAGIPFLAIRAVADGAADEIPRAAALALQPGGAARAFVGALARQPAAIMPLAGLGWRTLVGLRALRRAVRALGPDLALP